MGLEVGMPDKTDLDVPQNSAKCIANGEESRSVEHFELDEEVLAAFASLCLFRDVDSIRVNLRDVWSDCREGRTNLVAAAILLI
jgi:hypothetical protein